ncbi:MAG TPA: carbon storage regulator CsrA [Anaerolineaceae bacterium]|nr:carbon storage regulator CsrA [Anaerolineaceae bacterium]
MLVLTRRPNESLVINDTIVVTVLSVEGDKVKLGIAAPKDVPILRQELYQALADQKIIEARLSTGPEPESLKNLRDLLSLEFSTDTSQTVDRATSENANTSSEKPESPPTSS